MTVTADELGQYEGQKVIVVRTVAGQTDAVEIEGLADKANALGVLLKPKGRQNLELIEAKEIVEVRVVVEQAKDLKQGDLAPLKYGSARKHLADRHGQPMSTVNAMDETAALQQHEALDHADVSHQHVVKAKDDKKDGETPA